MIPLLQTSNTTTTTPVGGLCERAEREAAAAGRTRAFGGAWTRWERPLDAGKRRKSLSQCDECAPASK
jgi:hypothetical protein